MKRIIFYTKENCLLCDEIYSLVEMFTYEYPVEIELIDIYTDDTLLEKYHVSIPVVKIGEEELVGDELSYERIETSIQQYVNM